MRVLVVDDHKNTRESLALGLDLVAVARERDTGLMTASDVNENQRRRIDALGVRLVIKPVTAKQHAILCAQHDPVATTKGTRS